MPNPSAVPFPVILDTGNTHTFAIQERHLLDWAGIRAETMELLGNLRDRGQRIPLRAVNIWVHSNERRSRDQPAERGPHILVAPKGIAVYPDDFPRLPLLGLRAIADNRLILKVDGTRREVTLRSAYRWWPFS